jgi:peptidoglycan hydrolase-like protein with peptidoglycan-binding domain
MIGKRVVRLRTRLAMTAGGLVATAAALIVAAAPAQAATCGGTTTLPRTYYSNTILFRVPGQSYTCTLRQGDTGDAVRALQRTLNICWHKYYGSIDGIFGPATRDALKGAQSWLGVTADGVYGQQTRGAMKFYGANSFGNVKVCAYIFSHGGAYRV